MKIFASKPTKQDIFISVIIFLCGILFCFGISKFKGVGKEHNIKSDTILIKKDSITYNDSAIIYSLVNELKAREGYRDTIYLSIDYDKVKRAYTGYGHQMRKKDWKVLKFPLKREQVDSMLWADINITKKVKDVLLLLNIKLIDHIILSENTYYSFADNGDL